MLYSIPEDRLDRVLEIFGEEELEYCVLGKFNKSGMLKVTFESLTVLDLNLEFLYSPPRVTRRAVLPKGERPGFSLPEPKDLTQELLSLLSDPNNRSREEVIRTYDQEVRGCSAVKQLQGEESGPNDAAVIKPLKDSWMGLVISCGINPFYTDPYWMAALSIDEAVRNNTAVGGRRIAILDNFVWGNPEREDRMGSLLRAAEACYDFAKALGTPFISGKDSLYNESQLGPVRPTLLITGVGIIPDLRKAVTVDLKKKGDPVYIVGRTLEELGGSAYFRSKGIKGGRCPRVDGKTSKGIHDALIGAIDTGIIRACHDLSEGGLGTAAAEMVIASGGLGLDLDLRRLKSVLKRGDLAMFSESAPRYIVEVDCGGFEEFERKFGVLPFMMLGEVSGARRCGLGFTDLKGEEHFAGAEELRKAWRGH
jgi:phosphoribosylformylglycinamidine synthase